MDAYRDYGDPALRLESDLDNERAVLLHLAEAGIDLADVANQLESEGIDKFARPFQKVMDEIAHKAHAEKR